MIHCSKADLPAVFEAPQGMWRMTEWEGMNIEYMAFQQEVDSLRRDERLFIANEVALLSPELILGYHRRWRGKGQWVLRVLRAFDSTRAEQLAIALEAFYQHGTKEQLITPAQEGLTLGGGRLFEGYASQVDAVSMCATAIVRTAGALWVARALNMQKKRHARRRTVPNEKELDGVYSRRKDPNSENGPVTKVGELAEERRWGMKKFIMTALGSFLLPGALFGYVLLRYRRNRKKASRFYDASGRPRDDGTRLALSPVRTLEVLPLIDWYAARGDLETESGVSYLVRADETTLLFDLGLNRKGEQEPPLLRNMARLGVNPAEIAFVVLSHPHGDHIGGFKNQFAHRAIVRRKPDPLAGKPVYATVPLTLTQGRSTVVRAPRLLAPGIATTGPLPRALFLMGYVQEQALAINVERKGLVLLVGCGHPGVEALVERAEQLFATPVYGIIGGLHFPVTDDRAHLGPFKFQQLFGSPNPPWRPIGKEAVSSTLEYLKAKGIHYLAPSAHDTCDWSLHAFEEAFGTAYHALKVGEPLTIEEKRYAQQRNQ